MSTSYKPKGALAWFFKVWLPKGDNTPIFIILMMVVPLVLACIFALALWSPLPLLYWLGYIVVSLGIVAIVAIYWLVAGYVSDTYYSWKEYDEAEKQRVIKLLKD